MAWLVSSSQMITVLLIVQLTLVPATAQQAYEVATDEVDAIYYIRSTEFVDFNVKSTDTGDQRRQQYAVVVVVPHGEPVKKLPLDAYNPEGLHGQYAEEGTPKMNIRTHADPNGQIDQMAFSARIKHHSKYKAIIVQVIDGNEERTIHNMSPK